MTARPALLLFGAFALLAIYETAHAIYAPRAVATDGDWESAAAAVRAAYRPGDLIVFAPEWADQVGRQHLGDLVTPEMAGRADDDRYGRVWEVSIRGAGDCGRILQESQHGRVRVRLCEKAPAVAVAYDFTAHLAEARVTQVPADGRRSGVEQPALAGLPDTDETACLTDAGGFRCATTRVERRTLEIDYRPRRGVLAPVDGGLVTRIEFPSATLGAELVGYTGIHDYYSRKNSDGPVDFTVFVDGQPVATVHHRNEDGWRRFAVATKPGTHAVRFEVRAPSAAWRTFGFHAEARK